MHSYKTKNPEVASLPDFLNKQVLTNYSCDLPEIGGRSTGLLTFILR